MTPYWRVGISNYKTREILVEILLGFVVSQIPLYRIVLEYRTVVEEKICLTRGSKHNTI